MPRSSYPSQRTLPELIDIALHLCVSRSPIASLQATAGAESRLHAQRFRYSAEHSSLRTMEAPILPGKGWSPSAGSSRLKTAFDGAAEINRRFPSIPFLVLCALPSAMKLDRCNCSCAAQARELLQLSNRCCLLYSDVPQDFERRRRRTATQRGVFFRRESAHFRSLDECTAEGILTNCCLLLPAGNPILGSGFCHGLASTIIHRSHG